LLKKKLYLYIWPIEKCKPNILNLTELKSDICHEINEYLMLQIRELIKH
jgi:hypothetical protein